MDDVIEEIEFLSRSTNRVRILEVLAEAGRTEKDALQAAIDADRTTLTRNLDALEDRGWIQLTNPTCIITPAGRDIVEDFRELVETVDTATRFQEFFRWLPADEFDLDLQSLAGAELFVPAPGDPYRVVNQHVARIKNAEDIRVFLPLTGLHAHEKGHRQVVANGAKCELVVTPEVAVVHRSSPEYDSLTREMAATGRFHLYRYDGSIPFGLCLLDDTVQLFADGEGELQAMLETDTEPVRQWAERTFEQYRDQADPVPL